ncbi:hypothetical protein P5673_028468 [Acropora cervicornis]|uniref:Uncharacterized protein n=1 Tax=Acropora cervicornis TaxID=6130 RepID=A0AAD9UUU7_ACRCE|nr:hypothetical protein P5673_028468 [Acropora cervicornis]
MMEATREDPVVLSDSSDVLSDTENVYLQLPMKKHRDCSKEILRINRGRRSAYA